jgi:hypothetical protein
MCLNFLFVQLNRLERKTTIEYKPEALSPRKKMNGLRRNDVATKG